MHLLVADDTHRGEPGAPTDAPRVGLVVSKAVGNAVVRNRVKRRLRHLAREHLAGLGSLPGPVVLVVRALPAAATASYVELGRDLARCLDRAAPSPTAGDPTAARA